jgi:hypothetical protein
MNNNRGLITVVVLILIIIGGGWYLAKNNLLPGMNKSTSDSKPSQWQAVFLSNGQVYFGKLSDEGSQFITLEQIYYLQVQQNGTSTASPDPNQQQISLVKLGNELHGPVDSMRINREHVLFIEKMKSDAKVVEAIEKYIKDGPTTSASPAALTSPAVNNSNQ